MDIKTIAVIARRWFDRNGNTYFSANINVDGERVHRIPFEYGYGDHYLQVAFEWLDKKGITSREKHSLGGAEPPWRYCQDRGIRLQYEAADVKRKRDL